MGLIAWLLIIVAFAGMYPWARLLLYNGDGLTSAMTTLALSFGVFSLILMWLGIWGLPIRWQSGGLIYVLVIGIGLLLLLARSRPKITANRSRLLPDTWRPLAWIVLLVTAILAALVLFNALYWPIAVDDALAIYGYHAKAIALTGSLPILVHGSLYEAYPMAIPLWEATAIQLSQQFGGWVDDHLMALAPTLLSLGVIPVAYLIGRELYDRATGLIAGLLITLTPTIAYWLSASYADLPAGFFYGLTILFAIRHYRTRRWQDALLIGIMAGLAAWTKNSALLLVGVLVLWVIYGLWQRRRALWPPMTGRAMLLIGIGFLAVSGPWYLRNWLLAGVIVPPTGWTYAAQRSTDNLLIYIVDLHYWPSGWLFTLGLGAMLWQLWRTRARELAPAALLIGYLPFFGVWWLLFSYEDRFLLTLTPLIAVMGARLVRAISELLLDQDRLLLALRPLTPYFGLPAIRQWAKRYTIPRLNPPRRLTWLLVGLLIVLALPSASSAVLFKFDVLRQPFMSDTAKHQLRFGPRYDAALYLQTLPAGTPILCNDTLLPFLAYPAKVIVGLPDNMADLTPYRYWAVMNGAALPSWFKVTAPPVYEAGGYRVYDLAHLTGP